MLYIKYGSIFDEKCDLLVIPCDSNGGMTRWVSEEIKNDGLPLFSHKIPFGKAAFVETKNEYRKAYFVGYAASVDSSDLSSSIDAINSILDLILTFSKDNELSLVNIPVLGTGAGKLNHSKVIDLYNKRLLDSKITFNVYIPEKVIATIYKNIGTIEKSGSEFNIDNPRVFISYAWGDKDIQNWALELTKKLCANGINARIDKYHLRPGFDMPQWMTDEIIKADKVLIICDKYYADKANLRKAGVGWETMIVQGDMLTQGINNKYIAISCGDFDKSIPVYMKSKLALTKEEINSDIETLLIHLFEIDIAPEVSEVPEWIKAKLKNKAVG